MHTAFAFVTRASEGVVFLAVAAAAAVLVGGVRRLAIARGILDHPTHRGSHDAPTPRGGGLGVVVAVLATWMWLILSGAGDARVAACTIALAGVAAVGWIDDRRGLSVGVRLVVHVLAGLAVGALWLRTDAPVWLAAAGFVAWAFWTVSSINLVNFMDGINGFVASQIGVFAISLALFGWETSEASWYAAAVAAACLGFLPWNFPRARVFLGDVGSGALGFLVPVLALLTMHQDGIGVLRAHLPLVPLFGDAVVTIARRWRRGEKLTQAHRSHLYQRLANGGIGHTRVTLMFVAASIAGAAVAHVATAVAVLAAVYALVLVLTGALLESRLRPT